MIKRQKLYSFLMLQYDSSHFYPQIFSDHVWLNNHFYPKTSIILFEMLATSSIFRYKIFWAVYLRKVFFWIMSFSRASNILTCHNTNSFVKLFSLHQCNFVGKFFRNLGILYMGKFLLTIWYPDFSIWIISKEWVCTYCIKNQLLYWFFQETVSKFSLFLNLAFLNFCLMMTKKHTLYSSKFNNYFLSKLLPIKSWNSSWFFPHEF